MSNPGERVLAAEALLAVSAGWIGSAAKKKAAPTVQEELAVILAFGLLSAVALFGDGPARIAAGIGGLVVLVELVKIGGTTLGALAQTPAARKAAAAGGQPGSEPGGALNNPAARGPSLFGPLGT